MNTPERRTGRRPLLAIAFPLLALLGWGVFQIGRSNHTDPATRSEHRPASSDAQESVGIERALEFIKRSEYFINADYDSSSYQSPNRSNNLRLTYDHNGFTAVPRDQRKEDWNYRIEAIGIMKGSRTLSPSVDPEFCASENTLMVDHGSFAIEYENGNEGMRQNFIVNEDLSNEEGNLAIRLQCSGDLTPALFDSTSVLFKHNERDKVWYRDLHVWDANGTTLPARMELDGQTLALIVDDAGAAYPIVVDPLSTSADWVSAGNSGDEHGFAVSSAGDVNVDGYSDVIIGAPYFDNGDLDEGAAFVFLGSEQGLESTYDFMAEGEIQGGHLGFSVSTAGDVNDDGVSDIVVGMEGYTHTVEIGPGNHQNLQIGRVLVWHGYAGSVTGDKGGVRARDMGMGTYSKNGYGADKNMALTLNAHWYVDGLAFSNAFNYYLFEGNLGYSVSCAGDVNQDWISEIIVGAPGYDAPNSAGSAFVWHGTSWSIVPGGQSNGHFGGLKGTPDIPGTIGEFRIRGTIDRNSVTTPPPDWQASGPIGDFGLHRLGHSVSGAGDFNGDGFSDVIIGAPEATDGVSTVLGTAYVWFGSNLGLNGGVNGNLLTSWQWRQFGVHSGEKFGYSVSAAGDFNGDGFSDVIVGAPVHGLGYQGPAAWPKGKASIWYGSSVPQSSTPPDYYVIGNGHAGEEFVETFLGWSVSEAGDINGDGYGDVIIGDPGDTDFGKSAGKAIVLLGNETGIRGTWEVYGTASQQRAGFSVSCAGDVDGDGYSDVIVGSPGIDKVHVYHSSGAGIIASTANTTLDQNSYTSHPAGSGTHQFGYSISTAGDVNGDGYSDVIIGDPAYSILGDVVGSVFVFFGSSSGLQTPTNPSDPLYPWQAYSQQAGSRFGHSIAPAGDVNNDGYSDIIVGAPHYDDQTSDLNEGWVFVWYGSATGLGSTGTPANADWTAQSNQTYGGSDDAPEFGFSVSGAGDFDGDGYSDVIVGAPGYDFAGSSDEGAVFMWFGGSSGLNGGTNGTPANGLSTPRVMQANVRQGEYISCAGDFNGDGFSDFVVGSPQKTHFRLSYGSAGEVTLFLGQSTRVLDQLAYMRIPHRDNISQESEGYSQNAEMGSSVATAGDVNGDGYDDVIVGAPGWRADGINESGAAFIYAGTDQLPFETDQHYTGLNLTVYKSSPTWTISHNITGTDRVGEVVNSAGDLNGDGYADILYRADVEVGVEVHPNMYVHLGSPAGPVGTGSITSGWSWNSAYATHGALTNASTVGDVNGDGFSDLGMSLSANSVDIYYGNAAAGISRYLGQFQGDNPSVPVQTGNLSASAVSDRDKITLGAHTSWHAGYTKTKLAWEIVEDGMPFSTTISEGLVNSFAGINEQTMWRDGMITGPVNKETISGLDLNTAHRWRARVKTHPSTMLDGQPYSRWYYHGMGDKLDRNFLTFASGSKMVVRSEADLSDSKAREADLMSATLIANIVTDNIDLDLRIGRDNQVSIICVDAAGRTVQSISRTEALSEGTHRLTLPVHDVAPGLYFIVVRSGDSALYRSVIIR